MTEETKKYIDEIVNTVAKDLMHASHQGKSTEVSALFAEIKEELKKINDRFAKHEAEFRVKSVSWDLTTKIVYGLITIILLTAIGAILKLVIT